MMLWLGLLVVALGWCGGGIPQVSPPPPPTTTLPSRPEPIAFPLGLAGSNFVDAAGRPVTLWPVVECCWNKEQTGWPGVSLESIHEIGDHGGNAVYGRLGPHKKGGPDSDSTPDTDFLFQQGERAKDAELLGIIYIASVVDCWGVRTGNNYFGWDRSVFLDVPGFAQKAWTRRAVTPFLGRKNVLWEIGNECFTQPDNGWTHSSRRWEVGVRDEIRKVHHSALIGTNTHEEGIEQFFNFVVLHQQTFAEAPRLNKPTMVLEYRTITPERWEQNAIAAREHGTTFALWIGDMTPAQRQEALTRMARLAL